MGYRMLEIDHLYEVYRRVVAGESKRALPRDEFCKRAGDLADRPREKSTPSRDQLMRHLNEIRDLIAPAKDENERAEKPMRPKSAYRVIVWRHGLSIGNLTHSRKPFVQLVTSQSEQSFAESVVEMFLFYGGVKEFITVHNLIKPDLWDPQLNRSLAEVAEYYETFVNTARVDTATDKGKVERIVPVVREAYRVIRAVHPTATLKEMNQYMLEWCLDDYGTTPHGTTRIPPEEAFVTEQNALKPLPKARFEPATWKHPRVHKGDGFLTYNKMRFAVPAQYRGKQVAVRATSRLIEIFYGMERIRAYPYEPGTRVYYFKSDFPVEKQVMMDGSYPQYLLQRANSYGSATRDLISAILAPHAYLNACQAQGLLRVMDDFRDHPDFNTHCLTALRCRIVVPKTFKALFEPEKTSRGRLQLNGNQ